MIAIGFGLARGLAQRKVDATPTAKTAQVVAGSTGTTGMRKGQTVEMTMMSGATLDSRLG